MKELERILRHEIMDVTEHIKSIYPHIKDLRNDSTFLSHLNEMLWQRCIDDASLAPTLFGLFFTCSTSDKENRILHAEGNPD